jgi:isopenicillin-N epimerase
MGLLGPRPGRCSRPTKPGNDAWKASQSSFWTGNCPICYGVNVVARSLALGPGDEVLTTDHEYGACDNAWSYLSQRQGFSYREMAVAMPVPEPEEMVQRFWEGVSSRTRVIFMSHITSPTATRFPVEEICRRAREAGILSVIDGAHAPGQIPLNLTEIGADFYIGNAHKWLCAPKGSAFLYARFEKQSLIEPLVVGWGWGEGRSFSFGSDFLDYQQWLGTTDPAAYLSVPEAIQFQAAYDWPEIRRQSHALAGKAIDEISRITGLPSLYLDSDRYHQMATIALPPIEDLWGMKDALYDRFRIEIPAIEWNKRQFIRVSVQAYNSAADIEALVAALAELLPSAR